MNQSTKSSLRSLTLPIRFLVGLVIVADAAARPIYRPIMDWIASWRMMEAFEAFVARLPRFAILVLFAVPFAVAEPLKVFALLLMASGNVVVGLPLLIFSYLVTFLLVERIYHAGREKLLSYGWFAWAMGYVSQIRERLVEFRNDALSTIRGMISRLGF
ncbi:hypothetical protein OIU34_22160 [Pararhizobium sp. BT-229]|uniref:hypothetical protein n=1 Tax=Pararhizobium sp. BT-229 TaxID=2986923 RepID=UPI0021F69E3D|nr:hypothetical protein [Pararhizobium sp. BT-229]MCV9964598.1 hypothetical protein [Pararhizobium sp. BT-229]